MIGVMGDSVSAPYYSRSSGQYVRMIGGVLNEPIAAMNGAIAGTTLHATVNDFTARYPVGTTRLIVNLGFNDAYHMATDESGVSWQADWDMLWRLISGISPVPSVTVIGLLPWLTGMGCPWAYDDGWLLDYMDGVTRDVAYRHNWFWIPLPGMHAGMMQTDLHPNITGHAYIAGQVLKRWGV